MPGSSTIKHIHIQVLLGLENTQTQRRTSAVCYSPGLPGDPYLNPALRALAKPRSRNVHRAHVWNEKLPSGFAHHLLASILFPHCVWGTSDTVAGRFDHILFIGTFLCLWAIALWSLCLRHPCHVMLHSANSITYLNDFNKTKSGL